MTDVPNPDGCQTSAPLTAKQVRSLETALEMGYFETPRKITLKDLAAELNTSHQALSELLRRATRALTEAALSTGPETETQLWVGRRINKAACAHQHPNCGALVGGGAKPKPIDRKTAEWHDLEPCPKCAGTLTFNLAVEHDPISGGAD